MRLLMLLVVLLWAVPASAIYDVPNNDAGCPANCRQIPWLAGSDVWNGGTLPVRTGVNCTIGLTEGNGTTDNTLAIEACLAAIGTDQASVLPVGMFYVNGQLDIPSNKSLRGRGSNNCSQGTWLSQTFSGDTVAGGSAACTTLKLGTNGFINFPGSAQLGTTFNLSSGYTKGSQSIVASSTPTGMAVNDWLLISELMDTGIPVTNVGVSGTCTWCGENDNLNRVMTQIVQITSVSGTTIGLSRPLYYTFLSGLTPHILELTNVGTKAGLESIKLNGSVTTRTSPHIQILGCMLCWVKDVETYNTPNTAKAYPIYMQRTYGLEVRDSYFHFGQSNQSDRNYGIGMFGPNSDNKIENNIYRENRHALAQEGGGSGNAFLYNYIDDGWTEDATFLGETAMSHGAHPYMFLLEGNIMSHWADDDDWGSSSHGVLFRNWMWGDATGNFATWSSVNNGFKAMDLESAKKYYSAVGNILGGTAAIQSYPGHVTWSGGIIYPAGACDSGTKAAPIVYALGCRNTFDATVRSTAILHGNYDYKTAGQAFWDGGADHAIRTSMYYVSKPAFFGSCAWPPFDGTQSPPTNTPIPARERYRGLTTCAGGDTTPPSAPTGVQISAPPTPINLHLVGGP